MSAALALCPPPAPPRAGEWLTRGEVAGRAGVSLKTVDRLAARGVTISRQATHRGRNGKPARQLYVPSLPEALRAKLESRERPGGGAGGSGRAPPVGPPPAPGPPINPPPPR